MKVGIEKFSMIALGAIAAVLPANVMAVEHDLSAAGSQSVNVTGAYGGTAIFRDYWEQPTGTGVFDPFLSLDANGQTSTDSKKIEQAYNTDGHSVLYMDEHRPEWNTYLRVNDLASIDINGVNYFGFILDANESDGKKSLISVDNIRIYTSKTDTTASVGNNNTLLDNLGTLRWAMNDPLSSGTANDLDGFNVDQWVNLDAAQENISHHNSNGGSGQGDMVVYIPQSAFGDSVGTDDYVWFYNLNGVHYSVDKNLASEAGFEEWRAVYGPQSIPSVPDSGSTIALLGSAFTALGFLARRKALKKA